MKRYLLMTLVVVLVTAACGGSIEDAITEEIAEELIENSDGNISDIEIDQDSGEFKISVEGDEGESITFGGGEIPDGMNVAIPNGGEVTQTYTDSSNRSVTLEYPADRFDELVAFYDNELEGEDVGRNSSTTSTDEGEMKAVSWFSNDGSSNITVNTCFSLLTGELDNACVIIYESDE